MMNTSISGLAIVLLFTAILGCGKLGLPGNVDLFEGDNAAKAAAAIKEKAGTDKVNVISAEVRPNVMKVTIQSPANPKEQDEYTYERGSASGPKPVKIPSVFADFPTRTTEIGEINFAAIPATIKRAIEAAKADGAKVELISMDQQPNPRIIPSTKEEYEATKWDLEWRIFVEGTRISKSFWADKQGNLNEKSF